ncbi:putative bifunctional diguanylate cyclase/phosphodiesterase [Muricoccus aerilatus]|uniref:putative bifunctional diguanylate cyclase/phosphodiesterase n=1 Tax=Muricoccus aerilatus TaxID=452982 RepID=UPI000693AC73|nr:bifunctional diguanylate cyclase/phosphodiesterase [Roseomonas aerilata]
MGDELLVQVANRLVQTVPAEHLVARLGGDEFVVLCEDTTLVRAQVIANHLVTAFAAPFLLDGRPYRLTTSVGVAPADAAQPEDLMRSADSAMYAAKRRGGNQAVIFDSGLHEAAMQRLELEQDLYRALERGEFELHYQPLARVASGEFLAFEALLRWQHPVRGMVSPVSFIPLAEETGLIIPIGDWVLREALRQTRAWRERHRRPITVSVNVSTQQVARAEFTETVLSALAETGLPLAALMLEVTESILADGSAVARLRDVQAAGVRVAIDDFGTGYSSLAYLQAMPVDELKVDRLFIDRLGDDARQTSIMSAIVQLAHTLDLLIVAEGVEREAQWHELEALGCDNAQGYWISRPLPADGAEALLLRGGVWGHPPVAEMQPWQVDQREGKFLRGAGSTAEA